MNWLSISYKQFSNSMQHTYMSRTFQSLQTIQKRSEVFLHKCHGSFLLLRRTSLQVGQSGFEIIKTGKVENKQKVVIAAGLQPTMHTIERANVTNECTGSKEMCISSSDASIDKNIWKMLSFDINRLNIPLSRYYNDANKTIHKSFFCHQIFSNKSCRAAKTSANNSARR